MIGVRAKGQETAYEGIAMNEFDRKVREATGDDLHSTGVTTIQANVGLVCNQQCVHCHVAASPLRKETMSWETMTFILRAAATIECKSVEITGGAPELNPHFRRFVEALRGAGIPVLVRTNLTVLDMPGMESMPEFFGDHEVRLVASLPCYLEENVDRQRGPGAHAGSIRALRRLNAVGFGRESRFPLVLVYNPLGPQLPPNQSGLEEDYRRELKNRYDVDFTSLITITNMPIGRFAGVLKKENQFNAYARLLRDSFNPATIEGLMCRYQINVDWEGTIYDCDFNLALKLPVDHGAPTRVRDFAPSIHSRRRVVTAGHCFGCTAGCGSSCKGALA